MARKIKEIPVSESKYLRSKILEFTLNVMAPLLVIPDSDMFHVLLDVLRPAEITRLRTGRLLVPILEPALHVDETSGSRDDLPRRLQRTWAKASAEDRRGFIIYFRIKQAALMAAHSGAREQYLHLLGQVQQAFKLSDCACDIITAECLLQENNLFHDAMSPFRRNSSPNTRIRNLCRMLGRPATAVATEVGPDAPLRRYGLIDCDFDLNRQIAEFLAGMSTSPLISRLFHPCTGEILDLSVHRTHEKAVVQILDILRSRGAGGGVNILLYGTPGTGKTALARSIGKALGLHIYEVNRARTEGGGDRDSGQGVRYGAVSACLNSVNTEQSLILVDEADDLLNCGDSMMHLFSTRRDGEKAIINTLLDTHKAAVIWITNAHDSIPESTRRRFDFSLAFSTFTRQQRQLVWENSLARHGVSVFRQEDIADFVNRYEINAGGIELAIRNVRRIVDTAAGANEARTKAIGTVQAVLASHLKLMVATPQSQNAQENAKDYSLDGLNVHSDPPLVEIVGMLGRFTEYLRTSQTGSPTAVTAGIRNMNLLLSGAPGTGKTEFAKFIARKLDQPLVIKRASDLLDCYVGNTEKRIRQEFDAAAAEKAILFIDEVDSLLSARDKAVRSWEVTQVNELLSCMENFNGIFVCATNFRSHLDPAALRRFNLKVDFDYLNNEGKGRFFSRYLETLTGQALTVAERTKLAQIDGLTPGDFKVVWQKHAFMQPASLSTERLLTALEAEAAAKQDRGATRKVGFAVPTRE